MKAFFGAVENPSVPGGWSHVPERIPGNWFSRREPYSNLDVTREILAQYVQYPKLFGGNVGTNNFDALGTPFDIINGGQLPSSATQGQLVCFLYDLATSPVPSMLGTVTDLTGSLLKFALDKLNPIFKDTGCLLQSGGGGGVVGGLLGGLLKE